ncbi:MAG: 2-octaprenyl-6-methoxyphenyl hydroxylase [Nevskiaceae bacterium]|nr:2-octaprenyl-6-methoxyphenyl hydroxylase [Nevskiaceae bacterium]
MSSSDSPARYDIAIVGGGLVGASLAVALRGSGRRVLLVEAFAPDSAAQPSFDERTTALGNASRRVFEALKVWPAMRAEAAPINAIHVSDAGRFAFARLEAARLGLDALGYVVPNRVIGRALWSALSMDSALSLRVPARVESLERQADAVTLGIVSDTGVESVSASLIVACDGGASKVRELLGIAATVDDYSQHAVIANVLTDLPNDGVAYERFTPAGPMALLPLAAGPEAGWRMLVWAARPEDAQRLQQLDAAQFLREWQQAFGWRAGRALRLGARARYPLALTRSDASVAERVVLIGNAAQALHPVAGQGFNLGLRDAAALAESLMETRGDWGDAQLLAGFVGARQADRDGVVRFTDTLVRTFSDTRPMVAGLRDAGLLLFDLLPPAKQALSRVSLGFGRRTPRLARGLPLR